LLEKIEWRIYEGVSTFIPAISTMSGVLVMETQTGRGTTFPVQ